MNEILKNRRDQQYEVPPVARKEKRDDFVGLPIFPEPSVQQIHQETRRKNEMRAEAKREAGPHIPTLSDDHFVPGDANERRLAAQRHARTRLEEINKERGSLKFWNVFKKAELDQEAQKLQYILKSEELRAKMETRAMEERQNIVRENMRKEAALKKVPNLQPTIDRIHRLKGELGVAFDAPERKDQQAAVDIGIKEWRETEQRMENMLIESFAQLGIDWKRNLIRDHSANKQIDTKRPWDDSSTELEALLRNQIQTKEVQGDPIKMRWAHAAADALAALRVLRGQTMRERKPAPKTTIPIERAGDFRASTDEELLGLGEIDSPAGKRMAA